MSLQRWKSSLHSLSTKRVPRIGRATSRPRPILGMMRLLRRSPRDAAARAMDSASRSIARKAPEASEPKTRPAITPDALLMP